jgi:hypothetical protein
MKLFGYSGVQKEGLSQMTDITNPLKQPLDDIEGETRNVEAQKEGKRRGNGIIIQLHCDRGEQNEKSQERVEQDCIRT